MNKISSYRKKAGLTQSQLAEACNWKNQSRISQYENDERTPNINDCKKIVTALNRFGVPATLSEIFPESG